MTRPVDNEPAGYSQEAGLTQLLLDEARAELRAANARIAELEARTASFEVPATPAPLRNCETCVHLRDAGLRLCVNNDPAVPSEAIEVWADHKWDEDRKPVPGADNCPGYTARVSK